MSSMICMLVAIMTCYGTPSPTSGKATPIRLKFEPGAICGKAQGVLNPGQNEINYLVKVGNPAHMVVNIRPLKGVAETANVGVVTTPSGKQDGTKGGIVFNEDITEKGDYTIRVARNLMLTSGGNAGFSLEVVIY